VLSNCDVEVANGRQNELIQVYKCNQPRIYLCE